jgi:hypothetical protein
MTDVLDRLLYRRTAVRISLHAILVPEVKMIQGRLPLDSKRLRALVVGEGGLLRQEAYQMLKSGPAFQHVRLNRYFPDKHGGIHKRWH